jgi:hypothetical protein
MLNLAGISSTRDRYGGTASTASQSRPRGVFPTSSSASAKLDGHDDVRTKLGLGKDLSGLLAQNGPLSRGAEFHFPQDRMGAEPATGSINGIAGTREKRPVFATVAMPTS